MRLLVAPNAFKDFASASLIGGIMQRVLVRAYPRANIELVPIADGGDGTIDCLVGASNSMLTMETTNPLGELIQVRVGWARRKAYIQVVDVIGASSLRGAAFSTFTATTYGLGTLINRLCNDSRFEELVIGLGGCIASDGGVGMAQALGVKFFDDSGKQISPFFPIGMSCADLLRVSRIDTKELASAMLKKKITVLSDVNIPLLGPNGQAYTFGPQKGADSIGVRLIESSLTHWCRILDRHFNRPHNFPYAGAAGGLGAALFAFAQASIRPGSDFVLDAIEFDRRISGATAVITGEGCLDATTQLNKACMAAAKRCRHQSIPYFGVFGRVERCIDLFEGRCLDASACVQGSPIYFDIKAIEAAVARLPSLLSSRGAQECVQ